MTESTTKSSKTQELINQGKDLINKGKFDEASSLYQSFLTFNEKNVEVLYELVKTYFYLEKPGELIDSAKKILKINRNHDKTYYLMARAYYIFLNNYHEASIRILKAIEINSNDSYYYSLASQIFYCMNNLKRASKLAQDSLNIDEKNFEALLTQAMIEQQNKNNEKAEELFRQALLYGPEGPSFYFNINHLHLKLASTKAGYKLLKEAISLYPDNEVYLWLYKYSFMRTNIFNQPFTWVENIQLSKKAIIFILLSLIVIIGLMYSSEVITLIVIELFKWISSIIFVLFIPYQIVIYILLSLYMHLIAIPQAKNRQPSF